MSYASMDHAGWVERQIAAVKRSKPDAKDRRRAAERRGWHAAPDKLNDFQRRAINVLGIVGSGIYNAPLEWGGVEWAPEWLAVSWYGHLSTYDFNALTKLVFLCHEACIRAQLSPLSPRHMLLVLHERQATGDISRRHPTLDEAIATFRADLPPWLRSAPAPQIAEAS